MEKSIYPYISVFGAAGDVYVRYELEQKEEFNEFLKKLENLWLSSGVANYSIMSYEQLEIRVKGGK